MARPEGSKITTETLLIKETKEWMKVSQRVREMIEGMLDNFQHLIDEGGGGVDGQLQLLSGLKDIMLTATRVVESQIKMTNDEDRPKRDEEDPEAVRLELLGEK